MGKFLTPLRAEKIREAGSLGRAKWRLTEPLQFSSSYLDEVLEVPAGFETDFASVPRIPVAYWLTGDTAHAAAVIHDYLVRTRTENSAQWADAASVFTEAMAAEKVAGWRRSAMYWIVLGADPYQQNTEQWG